MSTTANSTGTEKSPLPRAEKPMSLGEALEFLRSAFHFVALAGGEISVENDASGWLKIGIAGVAFVEDKSGDIYFQPISPLPTPHIASIASPAAVP